MLVDDSRARLSRQMSNSYDDEQYPMHTVYAMIMPDQYYCTRINTVTSYIRFQQKLLTSQSVHDWKFVSDVNASSRHGTSKAKIIKSLLGNSVTIAEVSDRLCKLIDCQFSDTDLHRVP